MEDERQQLSRRLFVGGSLSGLAGGVLGAGCSARPQPQEGALREEDDRPTAARPPIIIKLGSLDFLVREDDDPIEERSTTEGSNIYLQPINRLRFAHVRPKFSGPRLEKFVSITFEYEEGTARKRLVVEPVRKEGLRIRSPWRLAKFENGREWKLSTTGLVLRSAIVMNHNHALDIQNIFLEVECHD